MVVDNAWNQDHAQSEASLAAGKQSVERLVRGFWSTEAGLDHTASFTNRSALWKRSTATAKNQGFLTAARIDGDVPVE